MALSSIDFTRGIRYQEGIGKGEKLGILKGKLEGKIEGKIEDAKNMITEGSELSFIQRITGLGITQIEEFPKQLPKK